MKIRRGGERLGGMGTAKNLRSQTIIKEEEEIYALYYILYGVVRVYRMRRRRRVKMKIRRGWNGWAGWARPRINETRGEVDGRHCERDERKT